MAHGKKNRIIAIKSFCSFLREEDATLPFSQDPTLALKVPPARPERAVRRKGYTMEHVQRLYRAIGDQSVRNVVVLLAKAGMHATEVDRIARGEGEVTPVSGDGEIAATIRFVHKSGRVHTQSLDAQALAAAQRLQVRAAAPVDSWCRKVVRRAAKCTRCDIIRFGQLRHSFVAWARTYGAEVRPASGGVPLSAISAARTSLSEGALSYSYGYDSLNQLKRATDSAGNSTVFDYDLDGRRTGIARPNGVRTTYAYDTSSQVTSISHTKATAVLFAFSYAYDSQGSRISKTREDGTREAYTYYPDLRLAQVDYGTNRTVQYSLDPLGNLTFMTDSAPFSLTESTRTGFRYNTFNQLNTKTQFDAPFAVTNFAYDNNGNLLSETTGTQVKGYTWDMDNRLKQITLPSLLTNTFGYDANGLRIQKVDSTGTTKYLLNGWRVLEELDATNSAKTSYLLNQQVIDEIISFAQSGATYYPLADALGSICAIVDSTGGNVRSNSYDVYGERLASSGNGPQIAFGYTGREYDADTGMLNGRARYLNPRNGAWLSKDPFGIQAGANYYSYVGNNPAAAFDPFGLFSTSTHEYILDEAFKILRPNEVAILKRASADVDSFWTGQSRALSYQHHMTGAVSPGSDCVVSIFHCQSVGTSGLGRSRRLWIRRSRECALFAGTRNACGSGFSFALPQRLPSLEWHCSRWRCLDFGSSQRSIRGHWYLDK